MASADDVKEAMPARLFLASMSPRRAQLMREHGYEFEVIRPTVDEPVHTHTDVPTADIAEALSYFKARSVAPGVSDGLIVAADTVAAVAGQVFGKPQSREEAGKILRALAGTTHEVVTGVTLLDAASMRRDIRHATTAVTMRPLSERQIESYLDGGEWEGKAGAYGIQDHGDRFVERIDGSFTNVVGLPMEMLRRMINDWLAVPRGAEQHGRHRPPPDPPQPARPGNVPAG